MNGLPAASPDERIGVLGGTFDPPHVGHAIVALDVAEALELDRLLVVPAARPPHREARLAASIRWALVRDLFAGVPRIEVSDLELRRAGPSYTVDTLAEVRRARSPGTLYLVIGSDQLRVIETWHRYRELADLARLAVMVRAGREAELERIEGELPYVPVTVTQIDVSSTMIRERLDAGRSIRFLVPERIWAAVEEAWTHPTER